MIFAAIPWLSISINVLLVVFVFVCLLMGLLILMQRPKQEGLGAAFGGGVTDQVFGARTTNVLQKGTVYLGSLFFILSLTLAILIGKQTQQKSLVETSSPVIAEEVPTGKVEVAVEENAQKSIAEELENEAAPETPIVEDSVVEDSVVEDSVVKTPLLEDPVSELPTAVEGAPVKENKTDKSE